MFETAMKFRDVKFLILILIFSCQHLAQCKFLHRRIDDTDNTAHVKPNLSDAQIKDKSADVDVLEDDKSSAPGVEIKDDLLGQTTVLEDNDNGSHGDDEEKGNQEEKFDNVQPAESANGKTSNCWFPIEAHAHFVEMDNLDEKFSDVLEKQSDASSKDFDKEMLNEMLEKRAIAERALQNFGGDSNLIPAGLNLGGHCMMRMPQSILFFHRMKLRNNTRFRINFLHNDLRNMFVTLRFSLNDLHLLGDYERAITYSEPSTLYYTPTYGELEFFLRDVEYDVEARYRLIDDRLYVEHVVSELRPRRILMRYMKENNTASLTSVKLDLPNINSYLQRMQNDLDHWLKDYFNDFLIYFDLPKTGVNFKNEAYENAKTMIRNRFADSVIKRVRKRLRQVNASSVMIPDFKIYSVNEMEIKLYDGVIRGLDSIYRRSVATGKLDRAKVRHLDTIVGFSSLKVEYKYNMFLRTGLPPLFGMLVLDAGELTARLALKTVRDSPTLDMHFAFIAPYDNIQSLVVEGPANRYIAKYKHILEHQISSIMTSTMLHHMQQLDSLARCHTHLIGKDDSTYKTIDDSESVESKNDGDVTDSELVPVTDATDNDAKQQAEDPAEQKKPEDYIVAKIDSIELEFPGKDDVKKGEKMKLQLNQKFSLTRLKSGETRTG